MTTPHGQPGGTGSQPTPWPREESGASAASSPEHPETAVQHPVTTNDGPTASTGSAAGDTDRLPPETHGFFAPETDEPPPPKPRREKTVTPGERKRRLVLLIGLLVAVVLLALAALAFIWPAFLVKRVLDAEAVEEGVRKVLTNDYQITKLESVSCPAGRELRPGNTFECVVRIDNREQTVPITVKTEDGQYEVARPK